ncbi:MAG TPA: hypothetical protein VHC95_07780 [Opitutales bacterium]|nr:hypothetical protein [Opitutales bacterium]
MGWLDNLLGKRPDPTVQWGPHQPPYPLADVEGRSFGALKFGDPVEAAAFLGKPEISEYKDYLNYQQLRYLKGGFEVGFEKEKFSYLVFFIGPDKYNLNNSAIEFSRPRLRWGKIENQELTPAMRPADIQAIFGAPAETDEEADESSLTYRHQGMTVEFDFDAEKKLKRCDIFPVKQ